VLLVFVRVLQVHGVLVKAPTVIAALLEQHQAPVNLSEKLSSHLQTAE